MESKNFALKGIKHPGRVDVKKFGDIELATAPDNVLKEIYDNGNFPYLELTPEGIKQYYPEIKPIVIGDITHKENNMNQPKHKDKHNKKH